MSDTFYSPLVGEGGAVSAIPGRKVLTADVTTFHLSTLDCSGPEMTEAVSPMSKDLAEMGGPGTCMMSLGWREESCMSSVSPSSAKEELSEESVAEQNV